MKTHDELKLALAQALYNQSFTLPNWDLEQDHVKFSYFEQVENLLAVIDDLGLELRDKPKPEPSEEIGDWTKALLPPSQAELRTAAKEKEKSHEDSQPESERSKAPKRRRRSHQGDL